ncbi:nonribosomal peptide synthase GliP-like protein [Melanomma pulvis-pyrius CBS 109.77]|uniref:Nonribosomal peptide synthase GliP-like protein n=1 Tax=Melanomma pulvis-pyrius CBS 109.77 TaxID=1314802 RepID=A0A6A6XG71_9PLEO|nr:nonribosomal peptide synthase GliP-like protein [Melanomma pulvis-pyrius CBS 109.77]
MCLFCDCSGSQRMSLNEISVALNTPLKLLDLGASFIENGGDSLASIQLQAAFRRYGAQITFDSIFAAKTLVQLAENLTARARKACCSVTPQEEQHLLKRSGPDVYSWNLPNKRLRRSILEHKQPLVRKYPMTEMQLSLVHSTIKTPGRNVISYFETHPTELLPLVKKAWKRVLSLETIFKMTFEIDESGGYMFEQENMPFLWKESVVKDEKALHVAIDRAPSFDPLRGTWFDVYSLPLSSGRSKSVLMWRVHHAFIDGVSCTLIKEKVHRVLSGKPIKPGPSFIGFTTQLESLQKKMQETTVAFWKRQHERFPSPATRPLLPTPQSIHQKSDRPALGLVAVDFDCKKLTVYCRRAGVTLASLYYAAWGLVLSRYADSNQVSFGVVLSGRSLPIQGAECVIGPMINTLPLHISLNTASKVEEYARNVFQSLLELTSFEWSSPAHGFTRDFTSAVNVQLASTPTSSVESDSRILSDVPIHVEVTGSRIRICYDAETFSAPDVERLGASYGAALEAMIDQSSIVSDVLTAFIENLQRGELTKMGNWNSTSTRNESAEDDLVSLFVRTAEANPSEKAVEHCAGDLTYAQLHERSTLVARHLLPYINPGDVVCVHADGTTNWIVAIYAVLKTGATYCPFAPELPEAVRSMNYETSKARLFLTGSVAAKTTKPTTAEMCFSVEELLQEECTLGLKSRDINPYISAYLCFTSGSTGKPKGVLCQHRGLVAFQRTFDVRLFSRPSWKIAQFMSPGFDGSIHEIFSALSYGATLVLKDPSKPFTHLKAADAAILTPSMAKALSPDEFPRLKVLYLVGEAVHQSVCDTWAQSKRLFNMYGPTEATCGATIKELKAHEPVTLGGPNPSSRIYILDSQQRLAPLGAIGEVYLAGIQVAVGYVGLPEVTEQRFLHDTVNTHYTGEKMYKTGDRAFWTESGELSFLGRSDREIKLRGFRIDLDDLEIRMLRADDDCTGAAVTLQGDNIVALVQPAHLDLVRLRARLASCIPAYALPRRICAVTSFPTTRMGKLDYKAVSGLEFSDLPVAIASEANPSEQIIISALRDVLVAAPDTIDDLDSSLSDLGLDSILQLFLSHRLSRSLKRHVPLRLLLESSTIRQLAQTLDALQVRNELSDEHILGITGVSPIEKEWWQKYDKSSDTSSFNVTYACQLAASLDRTRLTTAWNTILSHHHILSCRYQNSESGVLMRKYSTAPPTVRLLEDFDIMSEANTPFNLTNDDLIRVLISPTQMLVVISHIICDLTTLQILLHEVLDLYDGKLLNQTAKKYAQTTWSIPAPPCHLSFWSNWLADIPTNQLYFGKNIARKTLAGTSHISAVPTATYESMVRFGTTNKISMHQLALSAVALAMQHDKDTCDIIVGAPYLNRNSEEDQNVVGLFLEPLPIRIKYPQSQTSGVMHPYLQPESQHDTFIQTVKRCSRAALSHAVPWDQLLSHLNTSSNFPDYPLFDTMVTFHDTDHEIHFPIDGVEYIPTCTEGAKFKLMAEFTARSDGRLSLRLEYSSECFSHGDIDTISQLIIEALKGLTTGDDLTGDDFETILRHLRACGKSSANPCRPELGIVDSVK